MTVQSDLQQAIASCEAMKGSYSMMAQATEDNQAKNMFNRMGTEVESHLQFLNTRLDYLNQNNTLNQQQ
ncbi:DUF1657 domain-containing protein [Tissierella sp.]|uniref:DUF1657 domain-containing protein n=1 Tax=Tissierella sp. TaxID=41274 RepID=UPI0028677BF6|nr:DUF1657 domain-containing protein [Tissierella sp.]MDR7855977.1 DUF1657 domain-containing protein [Tissierella sp.]